MSLPISVGVSTCSVRGTLRDFYATQQSHGGIFINGNDDFGNQAASEGWPGNGSIVNPYILQDLSVTGWNNLSITNVSCYFVVRNCEFVAAAGVLSCIYLDRTSNGYIESCRTESAAFGIYITSCHMVTVSRCSIMWGGGSGVYVTESTDCSVSGSYVHDNFNSGIAIVYCSNTTITANRIHANGGSGLESQYTNNGNLILHNSFYLNSGGIILGAGDIGCTLFNNSFGGNGWNAYDYSTGSNWDDGISVGNAWSDYSGAGTYLVYGNASSVDHYPRALSGLDCPVVSSPVDLQFTFPATSVTWRAYDPYPSYYSVTKNSTTVYQWGWWTMSPDHFTVWLYDLSVGVYNLTINVSDQAGNNASDSVIVQILPATTPPNTSTTTTTPYTTVQPSRNATDGVDGIHGSLELTMLLWFFLSVAVVSVPVFFAIQSKRS